MTKYDIRLKREAVKKSQIDQHKDFKSLSNLIAQEKHAVANRKLWLLLISVFLLIAMVAGGVIKITQQEEKKKIENVDQLLFEEFEHK
ncbi:hypothetical protein N6H18_04190 [Reichenbachiella agarivorans]|uniref:Uncharacterized protein n=1 Tax=Reichenbachiella agarivorans TaxID=2979464 RepID=A0ABY6CRP0_9BACT|nr:hypothetical protein [Reichenbachiella agarivorans]UXP33153.1 hypothetical protein N6H18_04190 [Reichenbachiella agarivorans]